MNIWSENIIKLWKLLEEGDIFKLHNKIKQIFNYKVFVEGHDLFSLTAILICQTIHLQQ